jgi:predicted RNase H-like nuclease (RuvC/YqgF family)
MPQSPNLFLILGREVKDEYGYVLGEVASFAVKPSGIIDSIYIKHKSGKFTKHPIENIKFDGQEVVLISSLKLETENLCDKIPLIWRKDQALKELVERNKISPEVYEDLHASFEGALNQLKSEAQALLEKIKIEIERCNKEIRELNYALVHLEVEHEIGEIPDSYYSKTLSMIQECLKKVNAEKADLEALRSNLSNILLGEAPCKSAAEISDVKTEAPSLPEPPTMVYMKDVGG